MDQSFSSAKKLDVLAFFDSSLLNCHFWPFAGVLRKIFGSLTREVWKSSKRYFIGLRKRSKAGPVGFGKAATATLHYRSRVSLTIWHAERFACMRDAAPRCAAYR